MLLSTRKQGIGAISVGSLIVRISKSITMLIMEALRNTKMIGVMDMEREIYMGSRGAIHMSRMFTPVSLNKSSEMRRSCCVTNVVCTCMTRMR